MTLLLSAARRKLERAELHTKQAERDIAAFGETVKPYMETTMLSHGFNDAENYFWVAFSETPLPVPPLSISLVLGDAVHNLRCALDYLAWQLVSAGGRKGELADESFAARVHLPVVGVPLKGRAAVQVFEEECKRRLPGVRDTEVDIVRRWQPFVTNPAEPEGEPLAVLRRLSNHDKHRSLRITRLVVSRLEVETVEANSYFVITRVEPLTDTYAPGAEFFRVYGQRRGDGQPVVRVGFPGSTLTAIYEDIEIGVTSVLHEAREAITTLLDEFSPVGS